MTTSLELETAPPSTYTVETVNNCKIIKGNAPLSVVTDVLKNAQPGAMIDSQTAKRLGAVLVAGLPEDLKTLRNLPVCISVSEEVEAARKAGLSLEAVDWILHGERGASSETVFTILTGVRLIEKSKYQAPSNADDFRRCRLLLESVPGLTEKLKVMSCVSPAWGDLVEQWNKISSLMDSEAPEWRKGKGNVPRTSNMIKSVVFAGD